MQSWIIVAYNDNVVMDFCPSNYYLLIAGGKIVDFLQQWNNPNDKSIKRFIRQHTAVVFAYLIFK